MTSHMPTSSAASVQAAGADVTAAAALAICESLMLALNDRNVLPEREILGVLHDAAAAHANNPGDDGKAAFHQDVADLINRIIDGGNSVRRP
jgi:hypothetical protein